MFQYDLMLQVTKNQKLLRNFSVEKSHLGHVPSVRYSPDNSSFALKDMCISLYPDTILLSNWPFIMKKASGKQSRRI